MPHVVVQRRDAVFEITLNRPEILNAVNRETIAALAAAVAEAGDDRPAAASFASSAASSTASVQYLRRHAGHRRIIVCDARCAADLR